MKKNDIIEKVLEKLGGTKKDATTAIETVFDTIAGALIKGDTVKVGGFGTFRVSRRAAREGVNPRTGEKIQIAAKTVPKWRPSKELKEAVK